jgi:hypothetical protein
MWGWSQAVAVGAFSPAFEFGREGFCPATANGAGMGVFILRAGRIISWKARTGCEMVRKCKFYSLFQKGTCFLKSVNFGKMQ